MPNLAQGVTDDAPNPASMQHIEDCATALDEGLEALRAVENGRPADVVVLERYAWVLEESRRGKIAFAPTPATEDDVRNARELVQLVRDAAPSEALVEPARRAMRVVTDARDKAPPAVNHVQFLAVPRAWDAIRQSQKVALWLGHIMRELDAFIEYARRGEHEERLQRATQLRALLQAWDGGSLSEDIVTAARELLVVIANGLSLDWDGEKRPAA